MEQIEEKKMEQIEEKKEDISLDTKPESDTRQIYDLGIPFLFWSSMKRHKHYIQSNYSNIKEEILNNKLIKFDMKRWKSLNIEAKTELQTDVVKKLKSNGFYERIYCIGANDAFSIKHLCALKLYTDYSKECSLFCSILRSENVTQIAEIGNWAKLLKECVQCYGSVLGKKKRKYYRGVKKVFYFEMFVTRFNLPTSTTIDFNKAAEFSGGSG
eukprot:506912_1